MKITPLTNAVPTEADALMRQVSATAAARQDHRPAAGSRRLDGLHPAFHAPQAAATSANDQHAAADRDPGRRDQPRADQDGGVLPRHDLREAVLARRPGTSATRPTATALAELVNAQFRQPFAGHWGDGTDVVIGRPDASGPAAPARPGGNVNPKYGSDPGVTFYTHVSDQYAPFHTKVINVGVRDATYVLDGLLYHESDLRIEEHYTDTGGFTDHVFALMHLLGFRFAPRIRDLADKRLVRHRASPA